MTITRGRTLWRDLVDAPQVVFAAREHPGQRELRGRAALRRGDLLDAADQVEVLLKFSPWKRGE